MYLLYYPYSKVIGCLSVCVSVTSSFKNGRTDWADTYIVIFALVRRWLNKSESGSQFAGKIKKMC